MYCANRILLQIQTSLCDADIPHTIEYTMHTHRTQCSSTIRHHPAPPGTTRAWYLPALPRLRPAHCSSSSSTSDMGSSTSSICTKCKPPPIDTTDRTAS